MDHTDHDWHYEEGVSKAAYVTSLVTNLSCKRSVQNDADGVCDQIEHDENSDLSSRHFNLMCACARVIREKGREKGRGDIGEYVFVVQGRLFSPAQKDRRWPGS